MRTFSTGRMKVINFEVDFEQVDFIMGQKLRCKKCSGTVDLFPSEGRWRHVDLEKGHECWILRGFE